MSLATFKNLSSSFDDVILIFTMGAQLGHTLKTMIANVFICITWLINEDTGWQADLVDQQHGMQER